MAIGILCCSVLQVKSTTAEMQVEYSAVQE